MDSRLYNKAITCPVCQKAIEITKVKVNGCKIASRDTDFCIHYEDINPIYYDVWVCEHCGYAAQSDKFEEVSPRDADIILSKITPRWNKRNFSGERTVEHAIETFKLALLCLQLRKAKNNDIAKVCVRLAWLYRIKKDHKEIEFLQFALKCYSDIYDRENFPVDKLDEFTCLYMIGELHRRVGDIEEAIQWFSRLISSPEARKNPNLVEQARDQLQFAKEQLKNVEVRAPNHE